MQFSREGGAALDAALDQLSVGESVALVESVWSSDGHVLTVIKGITGTTVDREQTCALLLQAVQNQGNQEVKAPAAATPPHPLDIQLIYDQLYAQAQDAYVETERYTVFPHVVGIDFDVEQVRTRFEAMAEGETMQVELVRTMPRMTTERLNKLLFADVLGECTTNIGGTENRLSNVKVAAKAIDGRVLMPGDTFSYDQTLGPRTTANGYLPAPAYIGGKTVDDVGGGICQDSSTLYLAALRANLEIVERTNHMYTVGYVPDGLDATVAYNAIDFKFKNNTEYPIRIEARVSGRKMIVRLHGTKTDDFTVKMETKTLSTTPYETIYKPDDSVAPGKTVVETTAYTGRKVQVYRCVYDEQGKLIGRTLESNNNYRHRDKVILYHPADAQKLGLIGADGQVHTTVQPVTPKPVEPEPSTPAVTTPETQQPEQPQPTEPEQEQPVEPDPVQPQEPSQPEVPESPAENVPGRIPEPPPSDVVDVEPDRGCPGETVAEMSRR